MHLWHLTTDAPRLPWRVSPGERVRLVIGTWPIEPGQVVQIRYRVDHADGTQTQDQLAAIWQRNVGSNSYWEAEFKPFLNGDVVTYWVQGQSTGQQLINSSASFQVGPKLHLALMWHQHQPMYKDTSHPNQAGSYLQPWVRLHAIRDYYSMVALVAEHTDIHVTVNLTPVLIWQIEDYAERHATDQALELTLKSAELFTDDDREQLLSSFFDADWHNQIFPHPRYKELFIQRREGHPFTVQDIRDLQMWFNLAWFGQEFRASDVNLVTGETVSVHHLVEQGRDFSATDVTEMLAEQYKIMRAVIPLHRQLQEHGQIEVTTTPFYHPILPILIDSDHATIDRPETVHPRRFAYPEDANDHVNKAVEYYQQHFGQPPRGMWPAEGAVSQSVIPIFAEYNIAWIATDRGVLARSGKWGYNTDDVDVLCQPYRAEENGTSISIFFRDTQLSDAIGFHYQGYSDHDLAAKVFIEEIKQRFSRHLSGNQDRILTVILDGENAWGAYRDDARPFLHALYQQLEADAEIQTVMFSEYLTGHSERGIAPHSEDTQSKVYDLFTGSWIDENGSTSGVDLGTWIGEEEENRGWELLGQTRDFLSQAGVTPDTAPDAFEALYIAEGSDWFWWFGEDQDSGRDDEFDDLFRLHLKNVYRKLRVNPPDELNKNIVPHAMIWTFVRQIKQIQVGDRLTIRTNCPGILTWHWNDNVEIVSPLVPVGGVMAGIRRYQLTLQPIWEPGLVRFRFHCTHPNCSGQDICCEPRDYTVLVD
ncbi:hypothetical protein G4Y79_01885 [Phototrophicus methaneseepsis]|uniref:Glycoside hydrolase family 57 N-terminal domain-containing protein n=1 Tax=Phototrophicus methaneseepsis TaxID=2710758 RepID=A0A7S8EA89_9CHLR|nr:glycoside hydrolase family 57 protein [Phototrophicus methaneseepsis]QPC83149.1 hypothetical protein G4Y79_01885 [Phototrophicus methaneseepsis]